MSLKIDDLILRLMEPVPPLPLIWEALTNIWKSDGPPPNVDDYFFENERLTNRLEKAVHECFFEVYDQLAEQAQEARAENLFGEEEAALIIMDGLSIREAGLFSPMITDAGFEVISRGYSFSCVPSVTAPFSQRFFGAATPSSIRRSKEFHYD